MRAHFGPWVAPEITAAAVDAYIEDRLEEDAAPATVNRGTQLLGRAFRLALERGKVTTVPSIRHLPEKNVREGFFERPEFEAVLAALPDDLRDLVLFAYLTGWRRGEICSLRWTDVDLDGGAIRLRPDNAKTGRGRTVMLDPTLRALMERRQQARLLERDGVVTVIDVVFHHDGAPVRDFRRGWASACIAAGLYHVEREADGTERKVHDRLFHDLRRTAIRNMIRAGVPERVAMEISGHAPALSSTATTSRTRPTSVPPRSRSGAATRPGRSPHEPGTADDSVRGHHSGSGGGPRARSAVRVWSA